MGLGNPPPRRGPTLVVRGRRHGATEEARTFARRSLRHHQSNARQAEQLLLRTIRSAHDDLNMTFQDIGDTLGCSKHWAWKLYQRSKENHA